MTADELVIFERSPFRGRRDGPRRQVGANGFRQLGHGELAVVGSGVLGGRPVPQLRELAVVERGGRSARPIRAAREADGIAHAPVHGDEMAHRLGRLAEEAKRGPTGEPLGVGERGAFAGVKLVAGGNSIGFGNMALAQGGAGEDRALRPPFVGTAPVVVRMLEKHARRFVAALAQAPAQALVHEAGMILERVRHPGDGAIDVTRHGREQKARLAEGAMFLVHPPECPAGRREPDLPQKPVEACDVIGVCQQLSVAAVQRVLFLPREVARDPCLAEHRPAAIILFGGHQGDAKPNHAACGSRRAFVEPGQHVGVRRLVGHRVFGAIQQQRARRPLGMLAEKSGNFGKGLSLCIR